MYVSPSRLIFTGIIAVVIIVTHLKTTRPEDRDQAWWGLLWFLLAVCLGSLLFDD